MNIHKNARTTPYSRLLMARRVDAGERVSKVAGDFCVSEQTVRKWVRRWRSGGDIALLDRSSRPARLRGTPEERIDQIERLRRQRMSSPAIARQLGMPNSTVTKLLRRIGLNLFFRGGPLSSEPPFWAIEAAISSTVANFLGA